MLYLRNKIHLILLVHLCESQIRDVFYKQKSQITIHTSLLALQTHTTCCLVIGPGGNELLQFLRHITFLRTQLFTSPVNWTYLCVKLGQLFFIKIELFVYSFLVSKLRGNKQKKIKISHFA